MRHARGEQAGQRQLLRSHQRFTRSVQAIEHVVERGAQTADLVGADRRSRHGLLPLPDVAVAVLPALSVTVSVTDSGCETPSVVLEVFPHVSVNEKLGLLPLLSNELIVL